MTLRYPVGIKIRNKTDQMTVEAEDALKVKTAHPEAAITYVRKQNARGDRRHPHSGQLDENPVGRATRRAAQSRSSLQTVWGTIAEAMPDLLPKPPGRAPGEPIGRPSDEIGIGRLENWHTEAHLSQRNGSQAMSVIAPTTAPIGRGAPIRPVLRPVGALAAYPQDRAYQA
jgi:hypothetical protein